MAAAAQQARATSRSIAVAAGTYSGDGADLRGLYVYGGYEAGTWRRDGQRFESGVEVTQPLVVGGLPDAVLMVPGKPGGLDALTVVGDFDGPLVNDLDVYGTASAIIHDCTLACEHCSEIVRLSNMLDVYDNRIHGGRAGVHADGRGSLNVLSRVRVCGNEIGGGPVYEYGIRIGLDSRGPLRTRCEELLR